MITFNHASFIAQAIEGVLAQKTSFEIKLIIGDDCSTDHTRKICENYYHKHPNQIQLRFPEKNLGAIPNFFENLKACEGKYIAICEGDDYWTDPFKLQRQVDFLEKNPDFIMCFTNGIVVDSQGKILEEHQIKEPEKDVFTADDSPFFAPTHTRVFRNLHIDTIPKDFVQVRAGDAYLAAWHSFFGKSKFLDINTSAYRIHDGGVYSALDKFKQKEHLLQTRIILLKLFKERNKENIRIYGSLLAHFYSLGDDIARWREFLTFSNYYLYLSLLCKNSFRLTLSKQYFRLSYIFLNRKIETFSDKREKIT